MAFPFPPGVSALIDPDDASAIAFLEACAEERRRLGLPSYTRDDLDRLFQVLDAPAPRPQLPENVILFPPAGCRGRVRGTRR